LQVKVCGITNLEDALIAIKHGADYLGFVFYEKSPRYISPDNAKNIISKLSKDIKTVALFVNHTPVQINKMMADSGADIAQIHFEVDEDFLSQISYDTLPVIRAKNKDDISKFPDRLKLVDVFHDAYGGSGERLNLKWFQDIDCSHIIIAGGLSPENVQEVAKYGFYGVDASSSMESSKGKKDHLKVKQFIENAKSI